MLLVTSDTITFGMTNFFFNNCREIKITNGMNKDRSIIKRLINQIQTGGGDTP